MKKEDIIEMIYNAYQDKETDENSQSEKYFKKLDGIETELTSDLSSNQLKLYVEIQNILEQYHEAREYELVQHVVDYCISISKLLK